MCILYTYILLKKNYIILIKAILILWKIDMEVAYILSDNSNEIWFFFILNIKYILYTSYKEILTSLRIADKGSGG